MYSDYPTVNGGLDEILDLSKSVSVINPSYSAVGRALVKFDNTDISSSISNYIGSYPFSAYFGMYLADASAIPTEYSIEVFAVSESWDMGTGRADENPNAANGVSWQWLNADMTGWNTSSYSQGVTGSFISTSGGGGNWYTGSEATESFNNMSDQDVYIDVSSIVNQYVSGTLINQGFLIKNDDSIEFDVNYSYTLKYFSVNTNTIYPPYMDLKWNDSIYNPNTGSMSLIQSSNIVVTLGNNKLRYDQEEIKRFNVNVREQYPARTFVTSSLYNIGEYLPSSSYWRLRDYDTGNIIFDFDTNYTIISTDQNGSYFNLFMNGLEPERYYALEIRVDYNGDTMIFDNDYYFKIER
jgi:hypothetical protein